jgi:hypothetical protein
LYLHTNWKFAACRYVGHGGGNWLVVLQNPRLHFYVVHPVLCGAAVSRFPDVNLKAMTQPQPPRIQLTNTAEYRANYANSVQVRVNLCDFFLIFGRVNQTAADTVSIQNFQGIYVSPQQAKALLNVLQQNVTQYEAAFGQITIEPSAGGALVQ